MTDLSDLPFHYDTEPNPAAVARKCRRHGPWIVANGITSCDRCGHVQDPVASRRGKNNRSRGNAIERDMGKKLGLRRVGQFGGPDDLAGDLFAAQVKSGGAFPERLWGWLKQVPVKAGQVALLVVADAPGPGHRRRGLVVIDLEDWAQLHGRDSDEAIQPVDPYLEEKLA
jgi:hypothetical protein